MTDVRRNARPRDAPAAGRSEPSLRSAAAPNGTTLRTQDDSPKSSYSSYKTAEERAAFIKQQAAARMAERMAALDIRKTETPAQKQERERKEATERLKKEEEEDAKREQTRQQRLAQESISPPDASGSGTSKKPAPPTPRKRGGSVQQQDERQAKPEVQRADHRLAEQALVEQQQEQIAETKDLECV